MENQVVEGLDLITQVGAPPEGVVDSAKTTEEGGSTRCLDVYRL